MTESDMRTLEARVLLLEKHIGRLATRTAFLERQVEKLTDLVDDLVKVIRAQCCLYGLYNELLELAGVADRLVPVGKCKEDCGCVTPAQSPPPPSSESLSSP